MKKIILILLFAYPVLLSTHCKKDSEDSFYTNSTFETNLTASVNKVRLFTRNGEITDIAIINRFVAQFESELHNDNLFLDITTQSLAPGVLRISFSDNNTATVMREQLPATGPALPYYSATFAVYNNDYMIVSEKDTLRYERPLPVYCETIYKNSRANYPVTVCELRANFPGSPPYQACAFTNTFPLKIRSNQLLLPQIFIGVKSGDINGPASSCLSYNGSGVWDTFKSSVINSLQPIDTIAIQEKEVVLRKL